MLSQGPKGLRGARRALRCPPAVATSACVGRRSAYMPDSVVNCSFKIKWPWLLVHLICGLALLVQLKSVFINYMEPTVFNVVVEERDLQDMDFPLVFKICVKPGFNNTALEEAGYNTTFGPLEYFLGRSKYNRSSYGWAGHTATSGVKATVANLLSRVSLHTVDKVIKQAQILTKSGSEFTNIEDFIFLRRANYPYNCLTLDMSNNTDLKRDGIKSLHLYFQNLNKFSIEIQPQGKSISCGRDIIDHSFHSTGSPIVLEKMGIFKKYAVQIKEHKFVEKDLSKGCRIYPNKEFFSYRLALWSQSKCVLILVQDL